MESPTVSDHDLLIQVNENVKFMREEVKQANQMINLKLADHDARLKSLEIIQSQHAGELKAKTGISNMAKWTIGLAVGVVGVLEPIVIFYLSKL